MIEPLIVIAENINIINKVLAEAMSLGNPPGFNPEPIVALAKQLEAAGATYLDVNIGPARKGGPELMEQLVKAIQLEVEIALCLDTTNHEAIEAGLKAHNNKWGPPIINSASADPKREIMFRLAKDYQARLIGLALGERGMPKNTEQRCTVAMEVLDLAVKYGVSTGDILLDPLVQTVNGQQDKATPVLETIAVFSGLSDPPALTIAGISNVSNSCPDKIRSILNRTYLIMAMEQGLRVAIVDPLDSRLMDMVDQANQAGEDLIAKDILQGQELKAWGIFQPDDQPGYEMYAHSLFREEEPEKK